MTQVLTPDDDIAARVPSIQHVFPIAGRAHSHAGTSCWCMPSVEYVRDDETGDILGAIVVHNREQQTVLIRRPGGYIENVEPPEYGTRHFAVGGAVPSPLETISLLRGNFAGGGEVPTLRAGQDAYGAAIQQTGGGASVPPPPPTSGMSQTDFNARKPVDADKVARQQEQLRKMLEARGAKPVKKAKGGAIRLHPSLHHHIAHALIKMAAEGAK